MFNKAVYSQAIKGKYRSIKNYALLFLLSLYFFSSWIRWDRGMGLPDQALLFDLPNRKAYLFFLEIWPEETYYLAGILILAALGLFFVTNLFGRIWCGYSCPHTVFVDLFIKVEHFFEGDRNSRIKLDQLPLTKEKFLKKLATHTCWMIISFGFAFGWVCYFYDTPTLVRDILYFKVTNGGSSWLIGLTFSTYLFAGWVRERVCTYMCPYGRFQSGMLDNDSYVVTYHDWRGEPRVKYNPEDITSGDCIACNKCVVVCPMGIDIREGLQLQCIGCGLCVDACNSVMEKIGRPKYLIGYDSINSTNAKKMSLEPKQKFFYTKMVFFIGIFILISSFLVYTLVNKAPYQISISHDRGSLMTILPDGSLRNKYTIKIFNKKTLPLNIDLQLENLNTALIKIQGEDKYKNEFNLQIPREQEVEFTVYVKTLPGEFNSKQKTFYFLFSNSELNYNLKMKALFIGDNNS